MSNQPEKAGRGMGTGRARGRAQSQSVAAPGASGPPPGAPPSGWGLPPGGSGPPPSSIAPGPHPPTGTQPAGGRGRAGRGSTTVVGQSQMPSAQQGMSGPRPQQVMAESQQPQPRQPPPQQPPPQQQRPSGLEEGGQGPPQSVPAGRASHRGAVDARPGQDVRGLGERMQQMGFGGGGDTGRGRQRGALAIQYVERQTKPQEMTSKQGTTGREVTLYSNLFQFQPITESHIYQYHVDFSPDVPSKRMRISMINAQAAVLGPIRITDGMLLFLPRPLPNDETELFTKRKVKDAGPSDAEEVVRVTIKSIGEVQPNTNTVLQIYNILFKRVLQHLGMTLIQRSYFNPSKAVHLDQYKIDIWPGYSTAIGLYEKQIGLVADVNHKVIKTTTVYDFMRQHNGVKEVISARLIGRIVMTRYNNKTYRIDDIDWRQNPTCSFKLRNGTEQRYMDYYKNAYNCEIGDARQPLLMSMPKKKDVKSGQEGFICLIPELCIITGLDDDMRANFKLMQDFAQVTRVGPHERVTELSSMSTDIANNPAAKTELANWNLQIAGRLAEFKGRHLPLEQIKMVGRNQQLVDLQVDNSASWQRGMRDVHLIMPVHLEKHSWLCIFPNSAQAVFNDFLRELNFVGRGMGLRIEEPAQVVLSPSPRQKEYVDALRHHCDKNFKLVMVVLNSKDKQVYDAAKVELCVERPVPSQFVVKRTITNDKARRSVATKVALQMNCKLGGELWAAEIPMSNAMVVGIDTYHDSASRKRSAVGVVASLNKNLTRYYSRCFFQDQNEELARGLNSAMAACLRKYHSVNGTLPLKIFVFRDGVGDGMLSMVEEFEIPQMTNAFQAVEQDYNPALTVIIVKKRMNTRIFRNDPSNPSKYANPPPGTIVDDIITKPMWYDFFIVSQSVNQGTVAPTHYHVLRDRSKLSPDIIQRLTYKLCYLYYNWQGTIRVPAPCQYAHKLAFLVGQSLHKPPHVELSDKLFYL